MPSGELIKVDNQAVDYELIRIWGLNARWLAEELLKLSRAIRTEFPKELGYPGGGSIETGFVWQVLPELARRLGATRLQPNESSNLLLRSAHTELRSVVGSCLQKSTMLHWQPNRKNTQPLAYDILSRSVAQGNPAAFATDKIVPAPPSWLDEKDFIAHEIRRVSKERDVHVSPYWTPELLFMIR